MKKLFSTALIFLLLILLPLMPPKFSVTADPGTIIVPDDYTTIQSAVDNANSGDTILVRNGTYFENVFINKTLTIAGENSSTTSVDGNGAGSVFTVSAYNVKISNFTIQNSAAAYPNSGIRILGSSWCSFKDNVFTNNFVGILIDGSYGNVIERNYVAKSQYGIYMLNSPGNRVNDNILLTNYASFVIFSSASCQITGNTVNNNTVGISMSGSVGNSIYYNNFINNSYMTSLYGDIHPNIWDNGYPNGGNYWSNYRGRDLYSGPYQNITGSDGLGDVPYSIQVNNTDQFPFMDPVTVLHDAAVLNISCSTSKVYQGETMNISVIVANLGNYSESFQVSIYYVSGSNETLIGLGSITELAVRTNRTLTFTWNTATVAPGNYSIKALAGFVEGDRNPANNILLAGPIRVTERFHDVAVLNVIPSASRVYQGQILNVSVTVANTGNFTESFAARVYYDNSLIGQQTVSNLEIGAQLVLVFSWDTATAEAGREYALKAEAGSVPGETNLSNNILVDGSVKVRSFALESIRVAEVVPSDHLGNPVSGFKKGSIGYFRVTVNSTSSEPEVVLVTVNVFDALSSSLGVVSFKGLIMPGVSVFILGLPILSTAQTGTARVHANTFTDWPFAGGLPYAPETSVVFQIQS